MRNSIFQLMIHTLDPLAEGIPINFFGFLLQKQTNTFLFPSLHETIFLHFCCFHQSFLNVSEFSKSFSLLWHGMHTPNKTCNLEKCVHCVTKTDHLADVCYNYCFASLWLQQQFKSYKNSIPLYFCTGFFVFFPGFYFITSEKKKPKMASNLSYGTRKRMRLCWFDFGWLNTDIRNNATNPSVLHAC